MKKKKLKRIARRRVRNDKIKRIFNKVYDKYGVFVVFCFFAQNVLFLLVLIVSYPIGEVFIETNTYNEMRSEIVYMSLMVITSLIYAIIYAKKWISKKLEEG